jgi:hypothetical protein
MSVRARDNPFLARLDGHGGRGAIRGAHGSGKTTLLRELGGRLTGLDFGVRSVRPSLDDRRLARAQVRELTRGAGPQTALLLDGADRVGFFEWRRLLKAARPAGILVITTHQEGRLRTLHRCATSVALLRELAAELAPATDLTSVSFADVFSGQQGNVRTALRALYDRFAES